jgi:GNAT superfamily N-acetyltransferase
MLRDLFYHLSDASVYSRYFSPRKSLPHHNLQEYVNLDESKGISLVVTIGPEENRRMIAEGRFVFGEDELFPDVALMVDENYQQRGIGTFMLDYLIQLASELGIHGMRADILPSNEPMLKIVDRLPYAVHSSFQEGVTSMRFRFDQLKETSSAREISTS